MTSKRGSIMEKINAHRLSKSSMDVESGGEVEMTSLAKSLEFAENLSDEPRGAQGFQFDTEESEDLLEDDSLDRPRFDEAERVTVGHAVVNTTVWNSNVIELAKKQIKSYLVRLETPGEYRVTFNKLDIVQTRLISYRLTVYPLNSTAPGNSLRGEVGGLKNKIHNARFGIQQPSDIHITFKSHSITGLFNVKCSLQLVFYFPFFFFIYFCLFSNF